VNETKTAPRPPSGTPGWHARCGGCEGSNPVRGRQLPLYGCLLDPADEDAECSKIVERLFLGRSLRSERWVIPHEHFCAIRRHDLFPRWREKSIVEIHDHLVIRDDFADVQASICLPQSRVRQIRRPLECDQAIYNDELLVRRFKVSRMRRNDFRVQARRLVGESCELCPYLPVRAGDKPINRHPYRSQLERTY